MAQLKAQGYIFAVTFLFFFIAKMPVVSLQGVEDGKQGYVVPMLQTLIQRYVFQIVCWAVSLSDIRVA